MAHFAEIDENNVVIRVLLIPDEYEADGQTYLAETLNMGGRWIQTSYNSKIRGKFAGIGDFYDENKDKFIVAKPFPSWIADGDGWVAPKPFIDNEHIWNEEIQDWIKIGETL